MHKTGCVVCALYAFCAGAAAHRHSNSKKSRFCHFARVFIFTKIKSSQKLSILQYIFLFKMRYTKRVAVWPVGLVTQLRAEGCIVTNGKVRKTPAPATCIQKSYRYHKLCKAFLQYIFLFKMRYTKRVAVWPVGLVTQLRAEGCIVTNGKVRYTPVPVIHGEMVLTLMCQS